MSTSRACPKCGERRMVREGMFHWRGTYFSGLVCEKCNALWDNPDDSFELYVFDTVAAETESAPSDSKAEP